MTIFKNKKEKPKYFDCLSCRSVVKNDRRSRWQHKHTRRHKRFIKNTTPDEIPEEKPITPEMFYISTGSNFSINIEKEEIKQPTQRVDEIKEQKEQKIKQPPQKIHLPPRSNNKILNGYDIFIFILDDYFNKKMKENGDNRGNILSSNNFINLKQELITSYAMLQEPNLLKVDTDRDVFKQIITHQSKHSKTSIYKFLFQLDKISNLIKNN